MGFYVSEYYINPLRSDLYVEEAEIKCFLQSNRVQKLIQVKTIRSLNLAYVCKILAYVFRKQEIDWGNFRPQLSNTFQTFARSPCFEYLTTSYVTSFFQPRLIVTRRSPWRISEKCWVAWLTKIVAFRWNLEIRQVNYFFFTFAFA